MTGMIDSLKIITSTVGYIKNAFSKSRQSLWKLRSLQDKPTLADFVYTLGSVTWYQTDKMTVCDTSCTHPTILLMPCLVSGHLEVMNLQKLPERKREGN